MLSSLISNAGDLVALVVLFGVTIFVHELGHFLAAAGFGMVVDTFSLGFGPAIWKRKIGGTTYRIGCIPVGGYVALPQLDPGAMSSVQGNADSEKDGAEEKRELPPISSWKKVIVSLAGASGNVALAVILAWIVFLAPGMPADDDAGTTIGAVTTNSVAYARGLRAGDRIVAVNGKAVGSWNEYATEAYLGGGPSNTVTLTLESPSGETEAVEVPVMEGGMGIEGVEQATLCLITEVLPESPAAEAGLAPGDIVVSFDGEEVLSAQNFISLIGRSGDRPVPVTVERDEQRLQLQIKPETESGRERPMIGSMVSPARMPAMPWMQYKNPMAQISSDASIIIRILRALMTPR